MSRLARAGLLTALFAVLCGEAAFAQAPLSSPSPSPSPSALPRIGGIVTSDRRAEAPSKVTRPTFVVDRSTIESYGSHTVADALANVPGVNLFSYGPFGAAVSYGIRGSSAEQTLILQDGIPLIAGTTGTVDLGSLSTIGLQRIEVVESGSSTLYGTNASGGVINLITASSQQPYVRVSDGTYGDRDAAFSFGSGGFALSFERHVASNVFDYPAFAYAPSASGTPNATSAGTRTNDDAQQTALRMSYHTELGAGWSARLTGADNATRIGVPGSLTYFTPDARQATALQSGQLDLTHAEGSGALTLTLAESAQKLGYFFGPGAGEDDTYDARSQASLRYTQSSTRSDLVTGVDLSRETAALSFAPSGSYTTPVGAAQSQSAAYAQYGYDPSTATRVTVGVRGENDAPRGSVVAPSLGMRADFGAARLTANVGESFRVPTLDELYYPGYANPTLAPERLTDYDTTLTFPILGGVSLGYFGRDGSNLIVTDPTTFVPYNASHASVNGMQLTLATRPAHHVRVQLGITDVYRALNTTTGERLPNTPPVVATLALDRPFDGGPFAFGARVRIVGSNADIPNYGPAPAYAALAPLADPYDAYTVADVYLRYRIARAAIATLRVRNLGDERYAPIYGYPAPGRTVELELSTR